MPHRRTPSSGCAAPWKPPLLTNRTTVAVLEYDVILDRDAVIDEHQRGPEVLVGGGQLVAVVGPG
ncbi:hypothetical protein ACWCPS_25625 [Streptomyces mauvecolor]